MTQSVNPLFVLNEIDKACAGGATVANLQNALLDLFEPQNATSYQSLCRMTECDLSPCMYICISDSLLALPGPLLSRLARLTYQIEVEGILRDM